MRYELLIHTFNLSSEAAQKLVIFTDDLTGCQDHDPVAFARLLVQGGVLMVGITDEDGHECCVSEHEGSILVRH